MAEQIPYGAASNIISSLASFAFTEFGRIYGVKDEMKKLKETLESIKVVISRAELSQVQDPVIDHWIGRFKKVLIDADDLLDDLSIKDLRRKVNDGGSKSARKVREFFSSENQIVFRAKLARKIENIRKSFNDVAKDMSDLKLNPSLIVLRQSESNWRETGSLVCQSDIIGREENMNDIVNLLKQSHTNQDPSLIAIVGMGGLGKTTLAQLVYNDAKEQELFQKYMWVCISDDFEEKSVVKKMLKSLQEKEVGDLELDILQQKLQEELKGQRYMLVLDDVWNEDHLKWDPLRKYLRCGGEGSKIVVTTRSAKVAETMGIKTSYDIKGLTTEQSWTLLKNMTFGDDTSEMSPSLESIGRDIAEKCGGVPLAIKTMGGLLRNSRKECNEWSKILNADDVWSSCKERQDILPVLNLSYQNLTLELRQCFAYCSLYPKDWEIEKDELIQLWMAQGYLVSSIETQSMEDVGSQYVKILLMRSFFQEALVDKYGDISKFKMHDLMHDLATSVAGNDCLLVIEGKRIVGRPMHVAFEPSTVCSLDMFDESKVRTIIGRLEIFGLLNPSFIKKLRYLRALDLSWSSIKELPESIDKIKHLRYLELCYFIELVSLPESIGKFICLQTLKLIECKLVSLPESIGNLISLRTLQLRECTELVSLPESIGNLISLQTLQLRECTELVNLPESIGNLISLQTLQLRRCGKLISLSESIGNLISLQALQLRECVELVNLPESIGNLISLQTLDLKKCMKLVFPIEAIPKLINLRHLDIDYCKAFREMMPAGLGKLTSLQYLSKFVVGDNVERKSGKLNELKELNNIRGALEISNLGLVKEVALEAQEANLKAKEHICHLKLYWGPGETNKNSDSSQLLDNLRPHRNLRVLSVHDYPGERFSGWLSKLTCIVQILLFNLPHCQHLPPLERLPCLKTLEIEAVGKLQCIHYEEVSDVFFPSLETLIIWYCEDLRGWERLGDANKPNDIDQHLSLPPFPRLSSLQISNCPNLTCMPAFPHLVEKLKLHNCSMKPLNETCLVQLEPSSLLPLSTLKHLKIDWVTEVEAMAEDWMQNLTSLEHLSLCGSSASQLMSPQLQHLPSQLEQLDFRSLESDKLCLRSPFHCLRSLQELSFTSCINLRALPEEIRDLQSLRRINIRNCPKLESLPEAMCRLTNLQFLKIDDCPLLYDRCKDESGEDWPKIAHIPDRYIS